MIVNVSRMGRLVAVERPTGRLYSGDARDGVCRCHHSYGDHHLLLAIEESRRAATDEEFVPAECLDPNCDCQQYVDRRAA